MPFIIRNEGNAAPLWNERSTSCLILASPLAWNGGIFGTASLWIPNNTVCVIVKCFFSIIIIPLIQFPSLARPINFQWHLSKWNKWNDCFLSFVQCVRHYVTYVGSLPYLEPIIWWVGRQPTSAEIRVLKSIGGEKHGWCLYSIWQKWTV